MKKRILYIILGVLIANVSFAVPVITFTANGATTFCSGNSSTKLRVTTTENIWVQLQYADIGSSIWTNVGFPTEILAGTPYDLTAYYVSSKQYQITYDFDYTMPAPTLFLSTITLTVNPLPTITTTGTLSALCYSTSLQNATLNYTATTYTPTSYTVDWNAAANSAGLSDQTSTATSFLGSGGNLATINIASSIISGTYNGSLIISNSNGCSNSKAISILIKPLPVVTFLVAAALNECQNSEVTYTTETGKTNYLWVPTGILNTDYLITNGGLGLTNNTVSLKWITTGSKTMGINYTDANFCTASASTNTTTTVNALPTITITKAETSGTANNDATICKGATITLSGGGASTYSWTGGISDGVLFSPTTTTIYTVTGTDINSCSNTLSQTVSVNALPTITITKAETSGTANNDATICKGATITLSGGGASTYSWTGGISDGVLFSPTTTTIYTVTGTDINSCSNTLSQTVSVNALPTITITKAETSGTANNDATICKGATITLSGGGASTYSWTGGISDGVVFSPTTTTIYTVTGTDINSCSNTLSQTVTVNILPSTPTVTSPTICEGQTTSVSMTLPTGTYTYTWTVPTGVITSSTNTINTTKAGTYSLAITDGNTCTSEVGTGTITVNALPAKPILTSSIICEGATASITGPTGVYTYTWTVPTGVATSTTKTISTTIAGTYSLTITDVNSCSSEVGTATVTVNSLPTKPTLTSQAICEGTTATITGPTGVYTYTWTVPTGVATSTTKTIITTKAGTYSLTITDVNSCSSEVGTATVTVNPPPAKPTVTSSIICEGATATITGPSGVYTYTWQVPTGVAASTTNTINTTKAGTYSLTIMDVNSCISEVGTGTVTVNPLPVKPTLTSSAICEGQSTTVSMSAPSGTYTYTWQVPTGVASSTTNTVITSKEGNYSLIITDANSCKSEVGTATVIVNALPAKPIVTSPTICEGQTATITAPAGVYTYTWQVPEGVLAPGNVNTFTTTKAGTYSLSIVNNKGCNSVVGSGIVTVNAIPLAPSISSNSPVEEEKTLNLTASNLAGATYAWSGPNGFASMQQNPSIIANLTNAGSYYATVTINGCTSVSSLPIVVLVTPRILTSPVFQIPNAFTPNSDGHNDTFKIIENGYVTSIIGFKIFTKSGKLIFSDKDGAWDGRYAGVMLDSDVYIWIADFINKNNIQEHLSGTVLLLK